ncbi:molybdenum cofactor biosynthesis protein B [Parvularcula sp. LCG005]|uniref:molybdenum cofactor biosynthesis protein B n=1 Tax=Parvularcula sp. LCG005 TaxID=3078805 RepID=UPI002941E090|nr:molybdenum cofactor biosynthesis protein B [Parvularcula sp. LCG005]WOI52210.1 molybdenum cofactor biosynthesis protein B [Parvularcula sp. LCG005]
MHGINESLEFRPVGVAVLTVSDTRTVENDTSGDTLAARIETACHRLAARDLLRDDLGAIRHRIIDWAARDDIAAIITTGGTGLTGRDVTVEAIRPLFDKEIDGFSVVFHMVSYDTVGLSTLQSRACAGIIDNTFVFCLPGSTGAVKDGWDKVIAAQLDSRHRPCNLVDIMPRLGE